MTFSPSSTSSLPLPIGIVNAGLPYEQIRYSIEYGKTGILQPEFSAILGMNRLEFGCDPFGDSKSGFLIDFTVERNSKSNKRLGTLISLANKFEMAASKRLVFFFSLLIRHRD